MTIAASALLHPGIPGDVLRTKMLVEEFGRESPVMYLESYAEDMERDDSRSISAIRTAKDTTPRAADS
jgi:hypothetical protein